MSIRQYIEVNVGGQVFGTSLQTLLKYQDSHLAKLFSSPGINVDGNGHYFLDRDGESFKHVLNYLRTGEVFFEGSQESLDMLKEESFFYGLPSLTEQLDHIDVSSGGTSRASNSPSEASSKKHSHALHEEINRAMGATII
eukprot:GCRY01002888.1.p1 GENE.GCRY01002888.1~~GCRY01002888.1.p1  ORF type:complete len:140 (+),score=14.26 GCRY01002888.1:73-492(+)